MMSKGDDMDEATRKKYEEASKPVKGYTKEHVSAVFDTEDGHEALRNVVMASDLAAKVGFMGDPELTPYITTVLIMHMLNYMFRSGPDGAYISTVQDSVKDVALNYKELYKYAGRALEITESVPEEVEGDETAH